MGEMRNKFIIHTLHILNPGFSTDVGRIKEPLPKQVQDTVATGTIGGQRNAVLLAQGQHCFGK